MNLMINKSTTVAGTFMIHPSKELSYSRTNNDGLAIANENVEEVIFQFYDDENNVIIRSVPDSLSNEMKTYIEDANDATRFVLQPSDVVIMQLGNTGVGKSSICQALTNNLNFRIGHENGTTIVPRAGVIQSDNCGGLRMVLIDVPGLNQAVVRKNRRLFVRHPKQPRKNLELEDIEDLIVHLTKLMLICLIVVDQKILHGFKDIYDKVLGLLVKGVRESDSDKYENISDDEICIAVKKRIIFVRNKCDHIYDHQNPEEMIKTEKDNIKQQLELTDEAIEFIIAGAYSASKGQGNFSKATVERLKKPEFLDTIKGLKKTINDKVREHAQELIKQLENTHARDRIRKEAANIGCDRILQRHRTGHVVITMLANIPNAARCSWYTIIGKSWKVGYGIDRILMRKIPLHEHPLSMFLGRNKYNCYICQICESKTDTGEFTQTWWYCKNKACRDLSGKWYVVHEECAEIFEEKCETSSVVDS